jgi:hypothetical protein
MAFQQAWCRGGDDRQGDKIGESSGKVTLQRVLPNPGGDPKMGTSFQATGKLLGSENAGTGTEGRALVDAALEVECIGMLSWADRSTAEHGAAPKFDWLVPERWASPRSPLHECDKRKL